MVLLGHVSCSSSSLARRVSPLSSRGKPFPDAVCCCAVCSTAIACMVRYGLRYCDHVRVCYVLYCNSICARLHPDMHFVVRI